MCTACGGLTTDLALTDLENSLARTIELSVPGMSCGGCVAKIENALVKMPGVQNARANLTLKRLLITTSGKTETDAIIKALKNLSFDAFQIEDEAKTDEAQENKTRGLLRAMAVAGFGAANIMLLSVSSWSGADGITRDLFHMLSALIAVPVVAFSGQPFFRSALSALFAGRVNMDVPISLAVVLALAMSLFQTMAGKPDAFFDAAVMLLFFLLIGRYLDQLMRTRARNAVVSLGQYAAKHAIMVDQQGQTHSVAAEQIETGMILRISAGSRIPADCTIIAGNADVDRSMVTGESDPVSLQIGDQLEAGTLNLTGSIDVCVDNPVNQSFLAEVSRMLNAAEQGKGKYVRIADRAARIYTPAVHILAATAFIGWMIYTGGDWQKALLVAISVLIITCPCALGLAVPVAHVVTASRLFQRGLLMRDGAALEKLANVKHAVFDKTGTVTMGIKQVATLPKLNAQQRDVVASLAGHSSHPTSMAIRNYLAPHTAVEISNIREIPGTGIEGIWSGQRVFIGKRKDEIGTVIEIGGSAIGRASFTEKLRPGAHSCMYLLHAEGIAVELLSGDENRAVEKIADQLGIENRKYGQTPRDKLEQIAALAKIADGNTLMVGDGINDAPCLAAADVSIAPSSAADVGRQASDFVMARESLDVLPWAIIMAKRTDAIVRQNFALAILYNCIAVPMAFMGLVTPLVAALAMSLSSIVVIANSLRLMRIARDEVATDATTVVEMKVQTHQGALA